MATTTPDDINEPDSITIIYLPATGRMYAPEHEMTHTTIFHLMNDAGKREVFATYYAKNGSLPPGSHAPGFNMSMTMMAYGDCVNARLDAAGELAIWPPSRPSLVSPGVVKDLVLAIKSRLRAYLEDMGIDEITAHIPTQRFGGLETLASYPTRQVTYALEPDVHEIRKVSGGAASQKSYDIDGTSYTLDELRLMRASTHVAGMGRPHPVLCKIDLERYPELSGYKPTNCDAPPPPPGRPGAWKGTSESCLRFREWMRL